MNQLVPARGNLKELLVGRQPTGMRQEHANRDLFTVVMLVRRRKVYKIRQHLGDKSIQ